MSSTHGKSEGSEKPRQEMEREENEKQLQGGNNSQPFVVVLDEGTHTTATETETETVNDATANDTSINVEPVVKPSTSSSTTITTAATTTTITTTITTTSSKYQKHFQEITTESKALPSAISLENKKLNEDSLAVEEESLKPFELLLLQQQSQQQAHVAEIIETNNTVNCQPCSTQILNEEGNNQCKALIPYNSANVCNTLGSYIASHSFTSQNPLLNNEESNVSVDPLWLDNESSFPAEEVTQNIIINISETPSSSMLHRLPLRHRMRNLFSDTIRFCRCPAFARDCIIILCMYIGFTLLIFTLTLLSYNFLRSTVEAYRNDDRHSVCPYLPNF
uniref:Uncharacterized protein n=1 Tax=Glossina palpalis gambiensis TaxID=67801 RepID=A0A1B0B1G1_9MUSC